jgi:hypothetical protein
MKHPQTVLEQVEQSKNANGPVATAMKVAAERAQTKGASK